MNIIKKFKDYEIDDSTGYKAKKRIKLHDAEAELYKESIIRKIRAFGYNNYDVYIGATGAMIDSDESIISGMKRRYGNENLQGCSWIKCIATCPYNLVHIVEKKIYNIIQKETGYNVINENKPGGGLNSKKTPIGIVYVRFHKK